MELITIGEGLATGSSELTSLIIVRLNNKGYKVQRAEAARIQDLCNQEIAYKKAHTDF